MYWISLRGQDTVMSQLYAHIKGFGTKLQLFQGHLLQTEPCTSYFPALHEVMDSSLQENMGAQTERYAWAFCSLSAEFKECFQDFAAIEKDMLLFSSVFLVELNDVLPHLQLELIELQWQWVAWQTPAAFCCWLFTDRLIKAGLQKCEHFQRKRWAYLSPRTCVRRHSLSRT